jgi:hypothetical protein
MPTLQHFVSGLENRDETCADIIHTLSQAAALPCLKSLLGTN